MRAHNRHRRRIDGGRVIALKALAMLTTTRTDWRRLATILLVTAAARILVFGNPVIHVDEEFYFVVARAMWRGALPFVDIWDRKPIGLFLIYLPPAALPLPAAVYAVQAMAATSVAATACLIARLADRAGWRGGTLAAVAYILWLNTLGGVGGQAPVFFNLIITAAGSLIVASQTAPWRRWLGAAALALVGLGLQVKYTVVFEGMFFGLWLLAAEWRAQRSAAALVVYGAALVAVALTPTLLAYGFYASHGQGEAFLFANVTSIFARNPDPALERLGNAVTLLAILSPLVAMGFGAHGEADVRAWQTRLFLRCWFGASLLGVASFGSYFDHYGLPVLVPGCACAAGFLGVATRRRLIAAILAAVALVGIVVVIVNRDNRGNAAQFDALTAAVGRGPGCLYVYSGTTMLYPATGRCAVSRYVFPSHLGRTRERGAIGVDQASEVRRILAERPAVIVMRPPYRGERPEIRAIVAAAVERDYRLAATRPLGREAIAVYRLIASRR